MTRRDSPPSPAELKAAPSWALQYDARVFPGAGLAADTVAFAVRMPEEGPPDMSRLEVLTIARGEATVFPGESALPGGFVDMADDLNPLAAATRELTEETGLSLRGAYVEPLAFYGERGRDPREQAGHYAKGRWVGTGVRVFSQAYLAIFAKPEQPTAQQSANEQRADAFGPSWSPVATHLPYEDLRAPGARERVDAIRRVVHSTLKGSPSGVNSELRGLAHRLFDVDEWNEEYALDRYRLLYALGLVAEARRDRWGNQRPARTIAVREALQLTGPALAFDHRLMLAEGLTRLRGKIKYHLGALRALQPKKFTLPEAQGRLEAVMGRALYTPNTRRTLLATDVLVPAGLNLRHRRGGSLPMLYTMSGVRSSQARLHDALKLPFMPIP